MALFNNVEIKKERKLLAREPPRPDIIVPINIHQITIKYITYIPYKYIL